MSTVPALTKVPAPRESRPAAAGPLRRRMTAAEIADIVRVKPKTILKWRRAGKMPPCHHLPSGDTVWDPRDVELWLESRKG